MGPTEGLVIISVESTGEKRVEPVDIWTNSAFCTDQLTLIGIPSKATREEVSIEINLISLR